MKKSSWKIRALALTLMAVCWLSGCSAHKEISVTVAETQEETRELSLNTEPEAETQPEAEPEEPAAEVFMFREDVPLSAELQEVLWDACQEHKVEYALALGLIETESSFNPEAVSYVGCYGLMQLNPDYFPADLSPVENIQYGVALIAEKLDQYAGNVGAALTAYNAGHDTGNREYAEKVMAAAERWRTE